ncbi:hypothetical protein H0H87_005274 [Tephrocybe sp. NHM501043]|nr:hypothetical protein H0H87_005274 [Tephrocybe sp. NHM501043]
MVAAFQILSAAALLFASQVLASPEPAEAIAGLVARQIPGFDPSTIPSACQSDCGAVSTSLTDSVISGVGKCLSCGVSISGSGLDTQTAQSAIDQIVSSCKSAGSPVDSVTISAKGSSGSGGSNGDGSKGNSAARSTVFGAGAVALAVLSLFATVA